MMSHPVDASDEQPLTNGREGEASDPECPTESDELDPDTYDDISDADLDNGFGRRHGRRRRSSWWNRWTMQDRQRRRMYSMGERRRGAEKLMGGGVSSPNDRHPTRIRRKPWARCNCCVYGGISGLAILAGLLFISLVLGAITFWHSNIDTTLHNWGKPGSGTEGLVWYPTDFTRDIVPLPCHSHNDYWRKVPLFSALRAGCTSVEADVWLLDNELYVGHNTASLTRNRTFQSLYVNPLVEILSRQNPATEFYSGSSHGVFDTNTETTLVLVIDLKTSGPETWPWVLKQLEPLRERGWLSFVKDGTVSSRPITVVGTGETPFDILTANSTYRDAFFDAPLDTMWKNEEAADKPLPSPSIIRKGQGLAGTAEDTQFNAQNSYYASVAFGSTVGRIWGSTLSSNQMKIIRGQVKGAHDRGLKARYWDLPDWPIGLRNHVWDILVQEGVDALNVDDLEAATKQPW